MSRKKKLKNIARGKTTSRMRVSTPVSHPKAEYMKYAGYDRDQIFDEKSYTISGRGGRPATVSQINPRMTPALWLRTGLTHGKIGSQHKGFKFLGKVYPIDRSGREPRSSAPKGV